MQRIKELDGLRAIAILLVLGAHYQGFASFLHGLPEFGWIGVDIFFVLSGYLITTNLLRLRGQPRPVYDVLLATCDSDFSAVHCSVAGDHFARFGDAEILGGVS
jgi:surface polysaccharide O-acyltransferase-like enzyme